MGVTDEDVVHGAIVAVTGFAGTDERACVVVQADLFNATHSTVTICPLTALVGGETLFRVALSPREGNGLAVEHEVQVDRITSVARERIVRLIGYASPTRIERIEQALRRWLNL